MGYAMRKKCVHSYNGGNTATRGTGDHGPLRATDIYNPSAAKPVWAARVLARPRVKNPHLPSEMDQTLMEMGKAHEQSHFETLGDYVCPSGFSLEERAVDTRRLVEERAPVIYQPALIADGPDWRARGHPHRRDTGPADSRERRVPGSGREASATRGGRAPHGDRGAGGPVRLAVPGIVRRAGGGAGGGAGGRQRDRAARRRRGRGAAAACGNPGITARSRKSRTSRSV